MSKNREEASALQEAIQKFIVEKNIPSTAAIVGISEFLIHYGIANHGTNFTSLILERMTKALAHIQESVALIQSNKNE